MVMQQRRDSANSPPNPLPHRLDLSICRLIMLISAHMASFKKKIPSLIFIDTVYISHLNQTGALGCAGTSRSRDHLHMSRDHLRRILNFAI